MPHPSFQDRSGSPIGRICLAALLPLGIAVSIGWYCEGRAVGQPRTTVVGEVWIDGQPADSACLRFHREAEGRRYPAGTSYTDQHGRFEWSPPATREGITPETYHVALAWQPLAPSGEDYVPGPNRLPATWSEPSTTPFHAVVTPQRVEWLFDSAACPVVQIK